MSVGKNPWLFPTRDFARWVEENFQKQIMWEACEAPIPRALNNVELTILHEPEEETYRGKNLCSRARKKEQIFFGLRDILYWIQKWQGGMVALCAQYTIACPGTILLDSDNRRFVPGFRIDEKGKMQILFLPLKEQWRRDEVRFLKLKR